MRKTKAFLLEMGELTQLTFAIQRWMFRKPHEGRLILQQMVKVGVESIPVALVTAFFTGMILCLQTGYTLETMMKGISQFVGAVVSVAMVRELGPLLTALIVAGRMGSAIAAEIGTMKVTEQIDALYTLSANPVKYLAVPRTIAFTLTLPLLTIFADLAGWLGGLLVAVLRLRSTANTYIDSSLLALDVSDILGGIVKSFFFGAFIAIISCRQGFSTRGGAEGVGRSTTNAVVFSFMAVLISDYFLTALLAAFHF